MKSSEPHYPVVIVGYGPTGACLAGLLALCGVPTLVLEREAELYDLPRAVHFDDEVMRVFQWIGVADPVAKVSRVNPGMRFVDPAGNLLLDWPRPQEISAQGWHASYRFHQPDLEEILRRALAGSPSATARAPAVVTSAEPAGNEVRVGFDDPVSGHHQTLTADWVIGCDGANSVIRSAIGQEMEDLGFHERWLVMDVLLTRPRPDLGDHTIQYCDPVRPCTYVRGPGDRRRWEFALKPDEDAEAARQEAAVWDFLSPWLTPEDAVVERRAVYTFRSRIANAWQDGRLLLAGDAAHLTPPFMGQGLCAGIRDVANLAWKLALVVKGLAGAELLNSYQSERRPNAKEYVATAIRLGRLINTSGTREALAAALPQAGGPARMESITPPLGPGLAAGNTGHTGRLFGQPRLADGRLMDEAYCYRPVLLVDGALPSSDILSAARPGLAVLSTQDQPAIAESLDKLGARAVLLRPDRYILGTADDRDGLKALLAGTLPSPLEDKEAS